MKKLISIVGNRPQFIKLAAICRALQGHKGASHVIIHTGQHFQANMSGFFFEQLELPEPDYNLGIHSLSHGAMTGRMIEAIEKVLEAEKGDSVLVYGDTNSTLAGALAASKLNIPVAHIEGGLRCYNSAMPEEINRKVVDHLSAWLFCPTKNALQNCIKEQIGGTVSIIGDVMYDTWLWNERTNGKHERKSNEPFVVCTIHRQQNRCGNRLLTIHNALQQCRYKIWFPVHPGTKLIGSPNGNIKFLPPVDYFYMTRLLKRCQFVITDSGGLQKEAYFAGKRCVVLRSETEWPELIAHQISLMADPDVEEDMLTAFHKASKPIPYPVPSNLYGDGHAADNIVEYLLRQ